MGDLRRLSGALHRDESGQTAFAFVLALLAVFMFFALAFDTGLWFFDHRTAQNQVDAASLAALHELPVSPSDTADATAIANEWLARNGYSGGSDCSPPTDGTSYVMDDGIVYLDDDDDGAIDSLRVCVRRQSPGIFSTLFGVDFAYVSAAATATLDLPPPLETTMVMDDTGSMDDGCNRRQTNNDCPVKQARDAADVFVDTLLSEDGVYEGIRAAMAPFRGCYSDEAERDCVVLSEIVGLTFDPSPLQAGIADLHAEGGSGTNVCWGLLKGQEILFGPGTAAVKSIVLLSDGDNTYNDKVYDEDEGSPPEACAPSEPEDSDDDTGVDCLDAQPHERELDVKTMALANALKSQGVEIYVVGYGACGSPNDDLCNPSLIGGTSHDNTADRNLLKCIASSTAGTNDHYFEAPDPEDIPGIFEAIAVDILGQAALTK